MGTAIASGRFVTSRRQAVVESSKPGLEQLRSQLEALLTELRRSWNDLSSEFEHLAPGQLRSAENLVHYLTLRRRDIRELQRGLAGWGLSSLGRAESNVYSSIESVVSLLRTVAREPPLSAAASEPLTLAEGREILRARTAQLLAPPPPNRDVRIMVTLPSEAAVSYELVRDLVAGGMDCARVNCAHDDESSWRLMIANIRRAEDEVGRSCRISMDLAGPKLRTGAIEAGPRVTKVSTKRNALGQVEKPGYAWLTDESVEGKLQGSPPLLPVTAEFLARLFRGCTIRLRDTRGRKRSLLVEDECDGRWLVSSPKNVYIETGTELLLLTGKRKASAATRVGPMRPVEQYLLLHKGDRLILTRERTPGRRAQLDDDGRVIEPARIPCSLPEVFADVGPGESIWFDDAKLGGVIRRADAEQLEVEITHARIGGAKLRADKGINLPDSDLLLPALTAKDLTDLEFIVKRADMVGYSFVRTAADVRQLQDRLEQLGGQHLGVVLKIETKHAFETLPDILLAAMQSRAAGVMIARGDLAVEAGFERMAEVQEEIMWLCEAAHMPVIWATQVLEQLSKKGLPSRAEITDAAMSERAECVMLNKGPYVVDAVIALDDILTRMQAHQQKKRSMLRRLHLADEFFIRQAHTA